MTLQAMPAIMAKGQADEGKVNELRLVSDRLEER
jgi:hypothetical protein